MDDDYVQYILQKYRLAVTLAVIRNKPNNVTIEEYVTNLRAKLSDPQLDETLSNISINEDDFNLSDENLSNVINNLNEENSNDSVTILQNYDFEGFRITAEDDKLTNVLQTYNNYETGVEHQNTIAEEQRIQDLTQPLCLEHHISDDLKNQNSNNIDITNNETEVDLEYSKIHNDNITAKVNNNLQIETNFVEKTQTFITDINIFDSQETEIYSLHGFTEANTHISQSQDNLVIARNFLSNKNKLDAIKDIEKADFVTNRVSNEKDIHSDVNTEKKSLHYTENIKDTKTVFEDSDVIHVRKKHKPIRYTDTEDFHENISLNRNDDNTTISPDKRSFDNSPGNYMNLNVKETNRNHTPSQDGQLFSLTSPESYQNYSQNSRNVNYKQNASLDLGFLANSSRNSRNVSDSNINLSQTEISYTNIHLDNSRITPDLNLNVKPILDSLNQSQNMDEDNSTQNFNQFSNNKSNEYWINNLCPQDIPLSDVTKEIATDALEIPKVLDFDRKKTLRNTNDKFKENNTNFNITPDNTSKESRNERLDPNMTNERKTVPESVNVREIKELNERSESDSDADLYPDLSDSQAEVVPFKVIDELNKIKVYLNRRNTESEARTDSGYRTSSNSRGSIYSASQTGAWINQSSHCLFSYLSECPFLVSTMDINSEIAKVLGSLIDRLHEEENYPNFLEKMLDFISNLLTNVYEGKCDGDNENIFLNNDERIDRLLLLNKSQHIIKFTIEKITNILERFVENLQSGSHIELADINAAENLSFIFHLLEILLKKYSLKSSQSQNASQDCVLKRSTLTEIWRKRWNLSKNEVFQKEDASDVTAACSDVLNKVIVKSMDGYSLVAYAALQCFNLLQS